MLFWFITTLRYLLAVLLGAFLSILISYFTIMLFVPFDENPVVGGLFWLFAFLAEGTLIVPLSLAITAELVERKVQSRGFSWSKTRRRFLLAIPTAIGPVYTALYVVMLVEESRPLYWFETSILLCCLSAVFGYLALRISKPIPETSESL